MPRSFAVLRSLLLLVLLLGGSAVSAEDAVVESNLIYGRAGEEDLKLDVIRV